MMVLTALGGVAAFAGIVQFIRGADHPLSLYADIHRGWGIGFFANRDPQPFVQTNAPAWFGAGM